MGRLLDAVALREYEVPINLTDALLVFEQSLLRLRLKETKFFDESLLFVSMCCTVGSKYVCVFGFNGNET